ncbi:hypothetical protein [Planobispora rosea]|uniref:hypothetical protein n=1 Tax=Planobispora rosea TaxID=35762 RepID=UPI00114CB1B3|nr:hypothetical protein [Planobispora rosea]
MIKSIKAIVIGGEYAGVPAASGWSSGLRPARVAAVVIGEGDRLRQAVLRAVTGAEKVAHLAFHTRLVAVHGGIPLRHAPADVGPEPVIQHREPGVRRPWCVALLATGSLRRGHIPARKATMGARNNEGAEYRWTSRASAALARADGGIQ